MTLKEYLKVTFENQLADLTTTQKIAVFVRHLRDFLAAPTPQSDLLC